MTDYTSAEFWKGAPEGATHYLAPFFYKVEGPRVWLFDDKWEPSAYISCQLEGLGAKRPAPQWSGTGLPPVGIDIEVMHGTYGWIGARVVGADGEAAIVRTNDGYAGVFPHEFRPIRTPSQIAAELRTATIKRAAELCPFPRADSTLVVLEALYDNGLLKGDAK